MRIYLQTQVTDTRGPRYYHLHLDNDLFGNWVLIKEWGIQGSPGRVQKKQFDNIDDAESALLETRDNQIKKGYRVVFIEGQNNP